MSAPLPPPSLEAWLSAFPPRIQRRIGAARARIRGLVPQAIERFRPGWRLIGYEAPHYFAFVTADERGVRIGFEWGVRLSDPGGLLHGDGRQVRCFAVDHLRALNETGLAALILEAAALPPPRRPRHR